MPTSLLAIAKKAREKKDLRFFSLYRLIDESFLRDCWRDIRKNAASGVDRVSAKEYEENLMDNIRNLVERLKRKSYRARLVRRHWIPKPDGRQRPLGIPVVEDKLLQLAVKAGVLDTDDKVTHPLTGTPQGGIISPILANVYLHHVLDLWFHEVVKMHTTGEACLIRYADDFVGAFQNQDEAQHFFGALEHRLEKFGLQLAAAKSRVIPFSRDAEPGATRFDFLGFEFYWGKDRAGKPHLKRRTSRKKLRNSLSNFTQWCKQSRHIPLKKLFTSLNLKLRGYYNYYGVPGNSDRLKEFFNEAMGTLWKWLNRRSQRRSFRRAGFDDLLEHFHVPRPRILRRSRPGLQRRFFFADA